MTQRVNLKVGVSGVRGIVGEFLTPELVAGFATAFGQCSGGGRIIVGRDSRNSGRMLEHAVISGLLAAGCQPVLLGVVPTPTVLITVDAMRANGGIAITASHNPSEWNALKFIGANAIFLSEQQAVELLDVYHQPEQIYAREQDYRNIRICERPFDEHTARILANIDAERIRNAATRVAVDCGNGVGAWFTQPFLETLGCRVFPIHNEKDGIFRRGPEPIPEHLAPLSKHILENRCAIGFAQDPDGDRLAIVGGDGKPVGEQATLALAVSHVLAKKRGDVVVNLQTSRVIADLAAKHNCSVHYSKVGEINVVNRMLETNAVIGGEGGNGGVIWPCVHPCRDSFSAMALILERMAETGMSPQALVNEMPRYFTCNLRIPCSADRAIRQIRALRKRFASERSLALDGFRLDRDDSWVLIRPSNTEPILRISSEAETPEAAAAIADEFAVMLKE
jgi:phosphomannomutase